MKLLLIDDHIVCTKNAYYDKRYREHTRRCLKIIQNTLPILKKQIRIKGELMVLVRPIRIPEVLGLTVVNTGLVIIDPRRKQKEDIVNTLVHELCHVKQHENQHLLHKDNKIFWKGKFVTNRILFEYSDEYFNFPWEVEARKNTVKYVNKLSKHVKLNLKRKVNYSKVK